MKKAKTLPWDFMQEFKGEGKLFNSEWPTLPELFTMTVKRFPNNNAFTDFEGPDSSKRTFTWAQVNDKVQTLANWMIEQGVKKGDRVALTGKNSPEWAVTFLAALSASAIVVPLAWGLSNKEMENLLNTAKPVLFFVDEEKYDHFTENTCGAKIYSLSPKHQDTFVDNLKAKKEVKPNPKCEMEDTAAMLFTSGTTGNPKGVMLSHKNLTSDALIAQTRFTVLPTDIFYALLPLNHGYTMQAAFICPMSQGAEIVFGKSMVTKFLMRDLREGQISVMLGVPLLYNKLLAGINKGIKAKGPLVSGLMKFLMGLSYFCIKVFHKNPGHTLFKAVLKQANIYTLRTAICGGGPLSPKVFKAYNAAGIVFIQGYGLTETSPIIALNPVEHFKIESVGQSFFPYEDMKILNPDADGVGEIIVKGPMVMQGYYNMPEETKAVFTEDGYFKTGDIGYLDKENYLMLCGRAKNIIVTSGGKNVYPEEIEDSFQMFDDFAQISVVGFTSPEDPTAERIEAIVYPSDDVYKRLSVSRESAWNDPKVVKCIEEQVQTVNKNLPHYAKIEKVTIIPEKMEMTATLKVKRDYSKKVKK